MMIKTLIAKMRGYTVTGSKSFTTADGIAYSATILKNRCTVSIRCLKPPGANSKLC